MAFQRRSDWCRKPEEMPERRDVLLEGYVLRVLVAPDGTVHRARVPRYSPPLRQLLQHIRWRRTQAADSERGEAA